MPEANTDLLDDDDDTFEEATGTQQPGGGDDDFEEIDLPPVLCGIFRGHVSDAKRNPKKNHQVILEIKSEEPDSSGSTAAAFIDLTDSRQALRLKALCKVLGVATRDGKRSFAIAGGIKALKNKGGLFVADTFHRDDGSVSSSLAWGMPKDEKSPEWKEYAAGRTFTDAQRKALNASAGAIPQEHHGLFATVEDDV